jgi:predicted DsbA family dithiol-disulfide isomerase
MLLARADASADQNEAIEKLFHAHHVACEDIGDIDVLVRIAGELGMDIDAIRGKLISPETESGVKELIQESVERGVTGVPYFIINGRYGLSGAQPIESFIAAFDQVADTE